MGSSKQMTQPAVNILAVFWKQRLLQQLLVYAIIICGRAWQHLPLLSMVHTLNDLIVSWTCNKGVAVCKLTGYAALLEDKHRHERNGCQDPHRSRNANVHAAACLGQYC